MAFDLTDLIPSLSPLKNAGIDPDEALASGDPQGMLMAKLSGQPYQPQSAAPAPQRIRIPITPWGGRGAPVDGNNQPLPANNAPTPTSEPTGTPSVPGDVTSTGTPDGSGGSPNAPAPRPAWSTMAQQALQRQMGALTGNGSGNPEIDALEAKRNAAVAATPNPNDPNYKPSVGDRIVRGLQGVARGGIRGAIDPTIGRPTMGIGGGTAYGAPNSRFARDAVQNQGVIAGVDQQLSTAEQQQKDALERAKGFGGVATEAGKQQAADTNQEKAGNQVVTSLAARGLKPVYGPDGTVTGVANDETSEVYQGHKVMDDLRDAQTALASANADLAKAKNDPNSPAFKQAQQRAATAASNASAAQTRANAYMLNATAGNLGTTPSGDQIPGSVSTTEGTPVGSKFANRYSQNQGQVAQFNDVLGATDNIEKTATALVSKKGRGALADPIIAAGISQPSSTFGQWAQGQIANGSMIPEQRDYVTNLRAYRENLQALRKSAGGGVSDAQVNRLMEMAPGANTPDLDFLKRQTSQIRQTANRLGEGIPDVKGGHTVNRPNAAPPKRPDGVPANAQWDQQGNNGKGSWKIPPPKPQ